MLNFILRRLLFLPIVLFGVTLMIFIFMSFLSPYQLVSTYIRSPEELKNQSLDQLVKKYDLDDPIWLKYGKWMKNLAHGNLGYSVTNNMYVTDAIRQRFPATLELAIFAIIPVVMGGIWLGSLAARHHNQLADHVTRVFSIIGWSLPDFVGGLLILMIFYGVLRWLPPGRLSVWADDIVFAGSFHRYTGFNTIDSILNGQWRIFWDAVRHLIGPVVTLAYLSWAFLLRLTRSSMLEVLNADYVRTARAKGLAERTVIKYHVRRNALIPVVTVAGLMIIGLLGGAMIVETVFDYKGLGLLTVTAAQRLDYTCLLGVTLFSTTILVLANLVVDVLYAYIDPRVRLQ